MKTLKHLFTTFLLLCATTVMSQGFSVDGIHYVVYHEGDTRSKSTSVWVTDDEESADDNSKRYSGNVVIPPTVVYEGKTYTVTGIGVWAFGNCTELKSVVIPNTVKTIEYGAFKGCTSLDDITIPASVSFVVSSSFENTGWYNKQPEGLLYLDGWLLGYKGEKPMGGLDVAQGTKAIACRAFYECDAIDMVVISDGLEYVNNNAFAYCTALTRVVFPNSLKTIGGEAFCGCSNLSDINLPNSLVAIEHEAFIGCKKLNEIIIPASVTEIGASAFYDTGWYNNQPGGLVYIGDWLIHHKGDVRGDIVIANGTKYIGTYALAYSPYMTSVTIPSSVTRIDNGAFANCSGLTNVSIPRSVTSIERDLFSGCSSLESITIPNSVTSIGNYAFDGCSSLVSIIIPNSVNKIGYDAFRECSSLKNLHIDDSNMPLALGSEGVLELPLETLYLGRNLLCNSEYFNCFYIPGTLKSLTIGKEVTDLSDYVISSDSLESVAVAAGNSVYDSREGCNAIIETADNALLLGCKNTKIPENVISIGEDAFCDCIGLTSITIPNSVTTIGEDAFYGCEGLTSISISKNVITIGEGAFSDCTNLANVSMADGVSMIGDCAFLECESLTDIVIPNSVTDLGYAVFAECTSLESVTIGNGVKSIKEETFADCPKLEKIFLNNEVPASVGEYNFTEEHYSTVELYVPLGTLESYKTADVWKEFLNIQEFECTSIEEAGCDEKDERENVETIYDLQGRVVKAPVKGLYIINGKKVQVK